MSKEHVRGGDEIGYTETKQQDFLQCKHLFIEGRQTKSCKPRRGANEAGAKRSTYHQHVTQHKAHTCTPGCSYYMVLRYTKKQATHVHGQLGLLYSAAWFCCADIYMYTHWLLDPSFARSFQSIQRRKGRVKQASQFHICMYETLNDSNAERLTVSF